jgi:hypothetical protein
MAKSRSAKSKQHREFLMMKERFVGDNYVKYLDLAEKHFVATTGIERQKLLFMLFCYDYEFFTISRIAEDYNRNEKGLYERTIRPLKKSGYLEDYYASGRVNKVVEQMLGITNNSSRICLSHKGRHAVQRFYRMLDGREDIQYHDIGSGGAPINQKGR